jgi:hypothetical protein
MSAAHTIANNPLDCFTNNDFKKRTTHTFKKAAKVSSTVFLKSFNFQQLCEMIHRNKFYTES